MRKLFKITLYAGLLLLLNACSSKAPEELFGEWKLDKIVLDKEIIAAEVLGNPTYTFNPDNTYVIRASGQSEEGKWKYNEMVLSLDANSLDKETKLNLKDISEKQLIYEVGDETVSVVYLKK